MHVLVETSIYVACYSHRGISTYVLAFIYYSLCCSLLLPCVCAKGCAFSHVCLFVCLFVCVYVCVCVCVCVCNVTVRYLCEKGAYRSLIYFICCWVVHYSPRFYSYDCFPGSLAKHYIKKLAWFRNFHAHHLQEEPTPMLRQCIDIAYAVVNSVQHSPLTVLSTHRICV